MWYWVILNSSIFSVSETWFNTIKWVYFNPLTRTAVNVTDWVACCVLLSSVRFSHAACKLILCTSVCFQFVRFYWSSWVVRDLLLCVCVCVYVCVSACVCVCVCVHACACACHIDTYVISSNCHDFTGPHDKNSVLVWGTQTFHTETRAPRVQCKTTI